MTLTIREVEWARDRDTLSAFLPEEQLERAEMVCRDPRASMALAAVGADSIVGWALAHSEIRDDLGWSWDDDAVRSVTGTNACVEYLHVCEEYRRRGVASALVSEIASRLYEHGKRALFLHCAAENEAGRRFYVSTGWREEKHVRPAWAGGRDFFVYRRELVGAALRVRR